MSRDNNHRKKGVIQKTKGGELIKTFKSVIEAALLTGINEFNIATVCRGKRKSAGGFVWEYDKED